ncbi:hypothetical protein ACU4GD_15405 [Cupriavidus basilensis]
MDAKQVDALLAANRDSLHGLTAPAATADAAAASIEPIAETITIDDFAKIDLRVAKIVACQKVEGSNKLLAADAGPGRRQDAQRLLRHPVGVHARTAGGQAHRDGGQPGAAQDEVRPV